MQASTLVVGSGRLANHLHHYLHNRGFSFHRWSRKEAQASLAFVAKEHDLVLLAVSDQGLPALIPECEGREIVHFSGSFWDPRALGAHPLMTFGQKLFDLAFYDQIPLITDRPLAPSHWLHHLPNPKFQVEPQHKALYHGLCHLAGNYPKFLWMEIAKVFREKLEIPPEALKPFLTEILQQSLAESPDAFTGPFARKDGTTIESHLKALNSLKHLKTSYEGFLNSYREVQP